MNSKLTVIFLVKEVVTQPHLGLSTSIKHWLREGEIMQHPTFLIEKSTVLLLKGMEEKLKSKEAVYPCELLECVMAGDEQKKIAKRKETDKVGERPQLVRAKSLEDQMLQQTGYGEKGEFRLCFQHENSFKLLHILYLCMCLYVLKKCFFLYIELKQIEGEFVNLCGSASSLMNFKQFSSLMI